MAERLDLITTINTPTQQSRPEELLTTLLLHHPHTHQPIEYHHSPTATDPAPNTHPNNPPHHHDQDDPPPF